MKDSFSREIDYMRISVTDRCNLRCVYCMPEDGVPSLAHSQVLSYEEILRIVKCASALGIKKIRLTGGEPLVRRGIESLISSIKKISGIENVCITTNGILLPSKLDSLDGLDGVNISLDTLSPQRFTEITRVGEIDNVLEAINLCEAKGINTKINCVAMKGVNDDEFVDIASLAKDKNICVRFIEYMPIGKNTFEKMVEAHEIREMIEAVYGPLEIDAERHGSGPAVYYKPAGFLGSIGFITAMTGCFCATCNRVRLTAEGYLKLCLQYDTGVDLRSLIRNGCTDEELMGTMSENIKKKPAKHTFNDYVNIPGIEEKGMSRIGG